MRIPTPAELTLAFEAKGYSTPADVHLVFLRKKNGELDAFDDMACVLQGGVELLLAARCTTDPGKAHRMKPMNADGCAVWAAGQVTGAMKFGKHKGAYPALVPAKPIPVLRFSSVADQTGTPSTSKTTNIHRASASHESKVVGLYSAGCLVLANPADFDDEANQTSDKTLMGRCRASGQSLFTVTLLEWA